MEHPQTPWSGRWLGGAAAVAMLLTAALALSAMTVLATPGTGVAAGILARGTFDPIATSQTAGLQSVIQEVTIGPGGHTGWHTHPGGTVVIVESGTFTMNHDDCMVTTVPAGRGIVEPGGQVQLAQNLSTTEPLVLTVVYFDIPVGGAVRADAPEPFPDCAGTPDTAAGSNVTAAPIISRATFADAAAITGADERDVVVQQITIAPGGHTGWHSHPGATVINVQSGTFTIYMADDCEAQNYTAGQGVVEAGGMVQLARNEGTVPLVLYVTYFDVPPGGSFRDDEPEPAGCPGLAAVPTAVPTATLAATAAPTPLPDTSLGSAEVGGPGVGLAAALLAIVSVSAILAIRLYPRRSRS